MFTDDFFFHDIKFASRQFMSSDCINLQKDILDVEEIIQKWTLILWLYVDLYVDFQKYFLKLG
jgi:hypothetical protein